MSRAVALLRECALVLAGVASLAVMCWAGLSILEHQCRAPEPPAPRAVRLVTQ
jgi:hypothetical protein